eukprot:SAG11_NODE_4188_length_2022_cov_4.568903_2_plen_176_part_00
MHTAISSATDEYEIALPGSKLHGSNTDCARYADSGAARRRSVWLPSQLSGKLSRHSIGRRHRVVSVAETETHCGNKAFARALVHTLGATRYLARSCQTHPDVCMSSCRSVTRCFHPDGSGRSPAKFAKAGRWDATRSCSEMVPRCTSNSICILRPCSVRSVLVRRIRPAAAFGLM